MAKEKDCLRALNLEGAAGNLAGSMRGMFEADGGAQKSLACSELKLALIQWQMVCEGRRVDTMNSLDEFALEYGLRCD